MRVGLWYAQDSTYARNAVMNGVLRNKGEHCCIF